MSIYNDDRRYSDDPEEYLAWREEAKREAQRDALEYLYDDGEYEDETEGDVE